jgi:glutamate carboxypeptidase
MQTTTPLEQIEKRKEEMISLMRRWSEVNSGSSNIDGLAQMTSILREAFEPLGDETIEVALPPRRFIDSNGNENTEPLGKALHIRKRSSAPYQIFLGGHMDTVFGADHPFQKVEEHGEGIVRGPGVADLKGGLVVMLTALQALESSPLAKNIGWELVINPDEEIGSIGSAPLLSECAKRCQVGLVFEPSLPDGSFINKRKGSGNYAAVAKGRPAHVGREYEKGRNAILLLTRFIEKVDALRREGVIVNVGEIEGGGPVNVVPDLAIARFNLRVEDGPLYREVTDQLTKIEMDLNGAEGLSLQVHRGHFRSPKPFDTHTKTLFYQIKRCCEELALPCQWQSSGGVCDGNVLAEAGLPTIDTLGVRGGKIHTSEEFIILDSLVERAKLTTLYLLKAASGELRIDNPK